MMNIFKTITFLFLSCLSVFSATPAFELSSVTNALYSRGDLLLRYDLSVDGTSRFNEISITNGAAGSLTITNLTTENITYRGRRLFNPMNGDVWAEGSAVSSGIINAFYPYYGVAIASGTAAPAATDGNHQQAVTYSSSASASSGYCANLGTSMLFAGGELSTKIFQVANTNAVVARLGFVDAFSASEPTDGLYLEMQNGFIYGRRANNSSRASTTSSNQVALSTWYTGEIEVSSDATAVTFRLYNDSGTLLWSDSLSGSIPTTAGRETGDGFAVYYVTGGVQALMTIDAMGFQNGRKLTRYP